MWVLVGHYTNAPSAPQAVSTARSAAQSMSPIYKPGEQVSTLPGVDYSIAPATLLMIVKSDCGYCDASMPFYRRIVARRTEQKSTLRLIVGAPATDAGFDGYLGANGLSVDQTLMLNQGSLKVRATPTLLLVDSAGRVKNIWEGQLPETQERAVMDALFKGTD